MTTTAPRAVPGTVLVLVLVLAGAAAAVAALALGEPVVGLDRLAGAVAAASGLEHVVVTELRAPRLLLGAAAGLALGTAGLLLQESLRNPLAVPELLGVSSGAAAAVAITVVFDLAVPFAPLLPAALGAVLGAALTVLAVRGAVGPAAVLLVGAGVSAALQAIMVAATALSDSREQGVLIRYLLGSLTGTTWSTVAVVAPGLAVAVPLAVLVLPLVAVLRLGDDTALSLGLPAGAARIGVLAVACLLIAVVVGPCGPIAWVGFLAPQLAARLWPGTGLPVRFAACAGLGALVVVTADLLARLLLYPVELPVGGLTAVVALGLGGIVVALRAGVPR